MLALSGFRDNNVEFANPAQVCRCEATVIFPGKRNYLARLKVPSPLAR